MQVGGIGAVERLYYPRQADSHPGVAEVVWSEVPEHFEYRLPAAGGNPPVRVIATVFDGGNRDLAILARFAPRTPEGRCDATHAANDEALYWSPALTRGPAVVCAGVLAIPVRAGEQAQHRWRDPENDILYWRIAGPGWSIELYGGRSPGSGKGPLGPLLRLGYRVAGTRFEPPAGYPRTPDNDGIIHIRSSGLGDAALAAFLARLEYVGPRDARCRRR